MAVDADTGFITGHTLTKNSDSDASQLPDLLDQSQGCGEIDEASMDGAYDDHKCFDAVIERGIEPIIPPREGAVEWYEEQLGDRADYARNRAVRRIGEVGRVEWKKEVGYHKRSLSETAMMRYKTIFGGRLYSRRMETQTTEAAIKIKALNIMTGCGMPTSEKVAA